MSGLRQAKWARAHERSTTAERVELVARRAPDSEPGRLAAPGEHWLIEEGAAHKYKAAPRAAGYPGSFGVSEDAMG